MGDGRGILRFHSQLDKPGAILSSIAVDSFVCGMNCSMPFVPIYAEKFPFVLISASNLVAFEGVERRINYESTAV